MAERSDGPWLEVQSPLFYPGPTFCACSGAPGPLCRATEAEGRNLDVARSPPDLRVRIATRARLESTSCHCSSSGRMWRTAAHITPPPLYPFQSPRALHIWPSLRPYQAICARAPPGANCPLAPEPGAAPPPAEGQICTAQCSVPCAR